MRKILTLVSIVLVFAGASFAQGWRGIKPLHSTCDDVKKALNVDKCDYHDSRYEFADETILIGFASGPCPKVFSSAYGGWNVPIGTVTGIERQLHKPLPITDFDVDNHKWHKTLTDMIGQALYDNNEDGISLSAMEGKVSSISYYPPLESNKHLLCPKSATVPKVTKRR